MNIYFFYAAHYNVMIYLSFTEHIFEYMNK